MGYLFLLNLFVTVVQADDVITIFFDILALEFVQHLDDMAFELGRKDILGFHLLVATSIEYKVLTRQAYKRMFVESQDEENVVANMQQMQQQQEENDNSSGEEWRFYFFRRRKHKPMGFRWILKAAYFINLGGLVLGTIVIGSRQQEYSFHCKSISVTFGDQVWQSAYVTNRTDPTQEPEKRTLIYSYFNGVYKITGSDARGYPIYTEMNKIGGDEYQETVGAEIVYCDDEEAWIFRHKHISKQVTAFDGEVSLRDILSLHLICL
jgi:hypothetical protein